MSDNNSKKIFLSHKGSDKSMVVDFKETLELLGYDPWIDDDAMPAGARVDRAISQGMIDSCAVVFFITASFRDEGYLQTEIDHAVRQKHEKGDRFSIITLVFADAGGNMAEIPDLLKLYVWKSPRTPLHALREIVRALPVAPGTGDWKSKEADFTTVPAKQSPAVIGMTEEAKTILCAAVEADGMIMHTRTLGGEFIRVGDKDMIPDQEPRALANWKAGLEELESRRYIKDRGHKGKIYDVTRAGYEAADTLAGK